MRSEVNKNIMQTRKNIFLWALYDFANSIVSIVFFLYFAQWIVIDKGFSDFYFNLAFTVAALLLLFTAPIAGALLDSHFRRITGLRITTVLTFIFYGLCGIFAVYGNAPVALAAFYVGLYVYLLSFTFYTPLLNSIVTSAKRGLVSGLGIGANYLGQIVGLLIALPFAKGSFSLFVAIHPRAETLLPSVLIFFILALPMLVWFYEPKTVAEDKKGTVFSCASAIRNTLEQTKLLWQVPGIVLFLGAYFLFNDAILTAANNFPIFLAQIWGVSDTVKTYIMLGILITSALGGIVSGAIADKFGHKRTLVFVLVGWIFILPLVGLLTNFILFIITTTFMGLWFGANWAVSRSVMAYLVPEKENNIAFAYFGLAERASSLVGPMVWSGVLLSFASLGVEKYRIATLVVTLFIVVGLVLLRKVKSDR